MITPGEYPLELLYAVFLEINVPVVVGLYKNTFEDPLKFTSDITEVEKLEVFPRWSFPNIQSVKRTDSLRLGSVN